ncbi:hypothetical protein MIND_00975200 [Mycena indigotica]|uniref:Ricin B lectin domain-containing protein n=1 Tax=Mycena indigotica TaxID=2126181 RepID=A0A8H6SEU4_9AGAR|nr:uncharacterized protein MIND_00975200 [Mycena indigotica]KAF7297416.1 hypothetical protein MIND_00975200 [Mycena indigotica]
MLSQTLVTLLSLAIATSATRIQSANPAFTAAGIQGCVSVKDNADGAAVTIHDCNQNSGDGAVYDWQVAFATGQASAPQQIKVFGDKCLDVQDGANKDGTSVQIWTCDKSNANPNQQWVANTDSSFRWGTTNKCLDLRDGKITDGTPLQIWSCSGGPNQSWTGRDGDKFDHVHLSPSGNAAGGPFCVTASSNNFDAPVAIANCDNFQATFPKGNTTWSVPSVPTTGLISTLDGKCLTVPGSNRANGVKLTTQACLPRPTNQHFTSLPSGQLESANGNVLQIWECDKSGSNPNQKWKRTQA